MVVIQSFSKIDAVLVDNFEFLKSKFHLLRWNPYSMSHVDIFGLKCIPFMSKRHHVILQNENGPCPLIAIANILILTQRIQLDQPTIQQKFILLNDLVQLIADVVLRVNNYIETEQQSITLSSVFDILPKLARGLDLNIKFTSPTSMEFTSELSIFDALDISLVHGWVLDPATKIADVVGDLSYNLLVNEIIEYQSITTDPPHSLPSPTSLPVPPQELLPIPSPPSAPSSSTRTARVETIQSFLTDTASQLTYSGLIALHQTIKEHQMCVFFRNNHFSTLFKHGGDLYLLITDLGYSGEEGVVWERLDEVDGNTSFVDGGFRDTSESGDVAGSGNWNLDGVVGTLTAEIESQASPLASQPHQQMPHQPTLHQAVPGINDDASVRLAQELDREEKDALSASLAIRMQQEEYEYLRQQRSRGGYDNSSGGGRSEGSNGCFAM